VKEILSANSGEFGHFSDDVIYKLPLAIKIKYSISNENISILRVHAIIFKLFGNITFSLHDDAKKSLRLYTSLLPMKTKCPHN
jgi:ATP-dependent protease HslVU (ClpYQ) ATPase subunit